VPATGGSGSSRVENPPILAQNPAIQASKPANGRRFPGESSDSGNPTAALCQTIVEKTWFSSLAVAHNRPVENQRNDVEPQAAWAFRPSDHIADKSAKSKRGG
jgi:hypothetical protein